MSDQPQAAEPVPVQLTRIEGTINLIAYQMTEAKSDIADIKTEQSRLSARLSVVEQAQAASTASAQSWKTWLPIILAALTVMAAFLVPLFGG